VSVLDVALIPRATLAPTYCRRNPRMSRQRPSRRFEEMVDLISRSSGLLMDCCKADTLTPFENSETLYSKACRCNRQTTPYCHTKVFRKRIEKRKWIIPLGSASPWTLIGNPARKLSANSRRTGNLAVKPSRAVRTPARTMASLWREYYWEGKLLRLNIVRNFLLNNNIRIFTNISLYDGF
jgi:hypothetical protein